MPLPRQNEIEGFFDEREKRRAERQAAGAARSAQEAERAGQGSEDARLFSFEDLALAVPRGIEGFGRSVASLADALPGVETGIGDTRFLGKSETAVGGIVEGITQFAIGLVPGLGTAGAIGRIGAVARAGKALKGAGTLGKLAAGGARGATAGAVADFTAFDGNDERLSNLIQAVPALQNPVTEFLAADQDDDQITGRLKNVLEGLGIGGLSGLFLQGLKGIKAQRAARTVDATPEQLNKAINDALDQDEVARGLDESFGILGGKTPEDAPRLDVPEEPAEEFTREASPEGQPQPVQAPTHLSENKLKREKMLEDLLVPREDAEELAQVFERHEAIDVDPKVNPRKQDPMSLARDGIMRSGMNLAQAATDKGGAWAVRAFEDLMAGAGKQGPEVITTAEEFEAAAGVLADYMGRSPDVMVEEVLRMSKGTQQAARDVRTRMVALTTLHDKLADEYAGVLDNVLRGDEDALNVVMQTSKAVDSIRGAVRALHAEAGRGLRILGANRDAPVATPAREAAGDIASELVKLGGSKEELSAWAAKMRAAYGEGGVEGTAALMKMHDMTIGRRALLATNELFINNILGAAKTLTVNFISPVLTGIYIPLENMVGGVLTRNSDIVKRSMYELLSMGEGVRESLRLGWKATRSGRQIIDPETGFRDDPGRALGAIRADAFGLDSNGLMGQATDWVGKAVRIPTAIMRGVDEASKQIQSRAVVKADLMVEAMGKGLDGTDAAKFVEEQFERLIVDGQFQTEAAVRARAVQDAKRLGKTRPAEIREHVKQFTSQNFDPSVTPRMERALGRAREATLTTPLDPNSITGGMQRLLNQHPIFRLVVPFFRTPVNIAKFVGQRTDVFNLTRFMAAKKFDALAPGLEQSRLRLIKDLNSGDEALKSEALGRLAMGAGMLASGTMMAASGKITGRGPTDPELRQSMLDAGWLPYSFRTENGFVQYLKMDPYASFFGLTADVFDTMRLNSADEDGEHHSVLMAIAISMANNFTQRSFLQGIQQTIDALSDPQRNMSSLVEQYAGSIVPNSLAQLVALSGDQNMHDTHGLVERIMSRTPFMSESTTPLRNVLGEPVKRIQALGEDSLGSFGGMFVPIAYREVTDDAVREEFYSLQHGFSPPSAIRMGVDMREFQNQKGQTAHDRWLELHGQVKLEGRGLRQELRRLIRSRDYQRLDPASSTVGPSPRVTLIQSVISRYRAAALDQALREFPELGRDLRSREALRSARRRGLRTNRTAAQGGLSTIIGNLGR